MTPPARKRFVRPPLAESPSAEIGGARERLVLEIAKERIRGDPADKDAWFAAATNQAALRDAGDSLASLEKLAVLDPRYPGLWVLKAKLHARLGQEEEWRQARMKADEYGESPTDMMPCPICAKPIAAQSSLCPHCGSHTEPEEAMAEAPKEAEAPAPEPVKEAVSVSKPAVRTLRGEARKGLTNGLVLERPAGRPGAGAQGRTSGLTNGLGGRTNGLTNGLGRTNGLARPSGPTKGLAKAAGSRAVLGPRRRSRWGRVGLSAVVAVLVVLVPVVLFWSGPAASYPIQVDGQFGDWVGVTKMVAPLEVGPNPDIVITRVAVVDNIDFLAFYIQVLGGAAAGGPPPARITNRFFAFVDLDRSRATGYQVQGIGADRMVQVSTWGGQVVAASLLDFDPGRGHQDWNGWVAAGSAHAAAAGSEMEFEVPWSDLSGARAPVEVAFAARSWDDQAFAADVVTTSAGSYVIVSQDTRAPSIASDATPILSTFTFHATGSDVTVASLNVTLQGTFAAASLSAVDLSDEFGSLIAEQPASPIAHFTLGSFVVPSGTNRSVTVRARLGTADGTTVGAFLSNLQDVVVTSGGVAFLGPIRTPESLAYVGSVPSGPVVDGGFADWPSVHTDPTGDVRPIWNPDVDMEGYAFHGDSVNTYFMAEVSGTALNGTMVPATNPRYVPPANGTGNGTIAPTPPPPPPENGTDYARFYLDEDGSSTTGYQIGGVGADYLLDVRGKEGLVLSAVAMRFAGATPFEWSWSSLGLAQAAKDRARIEAAIPGVAITNVSRAYFELGGWNGATDGSSPSGPSMLALATPSALGPSASNGPSASATSGSFGPQPQDIAGNQNWYFLATAPSPNSNSCTNNFAAGTSPGTSATSTTLTGTQSICWYTPTGQPSATFAGPWDFTLDLTRVDSTVTFVPDAQGTSNQWSVKGCVLGSSYTCVNSNDGNTSYIFSLNNSADIATFNIPDWSAPPSPLNITNVRVSVWCYAASAQAGKVATYLRNGTSVLAGTATTCSKGPYTEVSSDYVSYPLGTARPWTVADINALEIGAQDADIQNREIRVTLVQLTVSYAPVYSVSIFLCSQANCGAGSYLYGPVNFARYGNNVTITTGSIPAQTLSANDRIRFGVALVSGTSVTVNYNGPTVPGTSDSRASIPIPEFGEVVLPIATVILIAVILPRWSRRRRRATAPPETAEDSRDVPRH